MIKQLPKNSQCVPACKFSMAAFHGYTHIWNLTKAKLSRLILHLFRRGGEASRQIYVDLYFLKQLIQLIFSLQNSMKKCPCASQLCAKVSKPLFCLNRLKNIVTSEAVRTLYFAMIHSNIAYCIKGSVK
jgi:hypothetical protein